MTASLFERMNRLARLATSSPIENADRLPHLQAVWRGYNGTGRRPEGIRDEHQIALEYAGGAVEETTGADADWRQCQRWRFGWAPR